MFIFFIFYQIYQKFNNDYICIEELLVIFFVILCAFPHFPNIF